MSLYARRVTLPTITPLTIQSQVIKVFNEDGSSHVLEVPSDTTARDLCQLCITKNRCGYDQNWTIFEQLSQSGIERIVEDHESVVRVQSSWAVDANCRFYFRKKSGKYDFFRNLTFFPEHMVSCCSETKGSFSHSQLIQDFMNPRACPEIHGHLQIKDQGKKSWKKYYFFLRRSGLYFSTKGTSKEPRHLQFIADLNENNVYTLLSGKKMYGAPTNFGFCLKLNWSGDAKDLKLLCADDDLSRTCWMTVVRLFKHGLQLYQNYKTPLLKTASLLTRSSSDNSLVAMDFTGESGRIIDNPVEALSAAAEEALSWRKRTCHRVNMHWSVTAQPIAASTEAFHRIQPWFHHRISREESQKLMEQQGLVDGLYLVRESQSNLKNFVLSLCYGICTMVHLLAHRSNNLASVNLQCS
ncbi:growth factor receptor-bound protein 14 isoform X2 [Narcine bancroftii]|uniref:growth factor receptor-bound protein 14 isoform X2 n=1 Tax=Narcine bancroftii TaxID=1343680 RepID=UPI003832306B